MAQNALPQIMVAPNGARKTKQDHPNLPITVDEIVAEARLCFEAGAGAIHAHVRDAGGHHVLDAGLYQELLKELRAQLPTLIAQITTEAVGQYSAAEQRAVVRAVAPDFVSVALREMVPGEDTGTLRAFYHEQSDRGVNVQHILYAPNELDQFYQLVSDGVLAAPNSELLLVLGRYQKDQQSLPSDLDPFLARLKALGLDLPWGICAFGRKETDCLTYAVKRGGKARIGFENNIHHLDGSVASGNHERVAELIAALQSAS